MKIFSANQIKAWDQYTIQNEPVQSVALMERAAMACFHWLIENYGKSKNFTIFCGKGNNGGDGLVIARLLSGQKYKVAVYIAGKESNASPDFEVNFKRLHSTSAELFFIENENDLPKLEKDDVVIDALFGTGLNKKPVGIFLSIITCINSAGTVISIDVPSGLFIDKSSVYNEGKNDPSSIVKANYTLTFQNQKLAFLMPENDGFTGEVILLNIGLSNEFKEKEYAALEITDRCLINKIYKPRNKFANKGNYGYACLLAGSYGMAGAAVLSSKACLRSGSGKLTCYTCKEVYPALQACAPEAMCAVFGEKFIEGAHDFSGFDAVGIGPGIGKHETHFKLLKTLFTKFHQPVVIDADALNMLSEEKTLLKLIPANSIITPHPKEFERLFGPGISDFDRIHLAQAKSKELNIYIILKGHYTFIASPDGKGYFNSTGNAGMATAGSGDVLTGIVTGLLAQKYSPLDACILGVYLHGLAGDKAASVISKEAMIAGDIIDNMGKAFLDIAES